jgi:hypothetical protein
LWLKQIKRQTLRNAAANQQIAALVYELYGLTKSEIKLVEKGQSNMQNQVGEAERIDLISVACSRPPFNFLALEPEKRSAWRRNKIISHL